MYSRSLIYIFRSNTLLPPILIDNQDNATLQYYGNWTDQIDAQVPNRTDPRPFKKTSSSGSSVSLEFNNTIAVAVYGSRNWGHWTYNVVS